MLSRCHNLFFLEHLFATSRWMCSSKGCNQLSRVPFTEEWLEYRKGEDEKDAG